MKTRYIQKGFNIFIAMVLSVMIPLGLMGCGAGSSDSEDIIESGKVVIALTDAPGDFVNYTVDVDSITLTKVNGTIVETLPLSTRIDFAQYTEMTEFLTASTVPAGVYTQVTLSLNYNNADIWVEDANGDAVQVGTIQDEDGVPISTLDVSVQFENGHRLVIAPGIPALLTLDFVLSASNQIDLGTDPPTLTVEPTLLADINLETPKVHRVRGPLKEVDAANSTFTIIIRPFYHVLNHDDCFGTLNVVTNNTTVYDLNGDLYEGPDGIQAMEALPPFTAVVAVGDLKLHPFRFEAREVYAGSSVPGGDQDVVTGNVIDRQTDVITIKGATLVRDDGSIIFNDNVTVNLCIDTVVTRQFSPDPFTIDDISIGQRIMVFGTLTSDDPSQLVMDATEGYARMFLTTLRGSVKSIDPAATDGQLVVDLKSIDARQVGIFDFQGTGIDAANDADPLSYQIETSTLDLSGLSSGTPVGVKGFARPFGTAPADFDAQTIINLSKQKAYLKVKWHPPTADAFESLSSDAMLLDMEDASLFHHVGRGRVVIDLEDLPGSPIIQPLPSGFGIFSIVWHGTVQWYLSFTNYTDALETRLATGYKVNKIIATGTFDEATVTFTAGFIQVKLQ